MIGQASRKRFRGKSVNFVKTANKQIDQCMIFRYLSHCRARKAHASLRYAQTCQSLQCSYIQSMDVDVDPDLNQDI